MANYNTLKNIPLVYPEGNIDLGSPNHKFGNIYVTSNIAIGSTTVNANNIITPKISSIDYPGDDLAANSAGGDTIGIVGTGFQNGATVLLDNAYVAVVTVVSDTRIEFTSPTKIAGSYTLYVVNPDGGTAIYVPGVSYSGVPNWTTAAGTLGSQYETSTVNTTVTATGDAPISYTLYSGTLPAGVSLSSGGVLTGTAPATSGSTTYTFTIRATDAQNQDTDRTFSLTINTDLVTWNSPADEYPSTVYEYSALSNITMNATSAAGKTITYTANSLPTGISISGNIIYGTPTTIANTVSNVTANAASTFRTASRKLKFNVLQDVVTWSSPADQTNYAVNANTAISNVSLSATSAAGKTITYTANTLPNGISLSGNTISGTPTTVANTATLLTATAATTNRSATRTITWTVSLAPILLDSNWNYVSLLLSADTTVTTSSFVNDASSTRALITVSGDTRPQNFNPYTPGYYSNYFDGTGDYLTLPNSSSFAFGTGDFTIEYWINTTDTGGGLIAQALVGGWGTTIFNSTIYWQSSYNTTNLWTYSAASIIDGKWHHLAFSRVSSSTKFFIDGVLVATNADSTNYTATTGDILIGRDSNPADLIGYISNLRIIKGTGLYTANFTPSTTPLTAISGTSLLTCQSNRLIDASTNNFAVTKNGDVSVKSIIPFALDSNYATYGSGYFDGTGDYLTVPYSSSMVQWWDTDYTIEMWVYNTSNVQSANGFPTQISYGTPASATVYWAFGTVNSGYLKFYYYQGSGASLTSTAVVPLNTWTHIAMVYTNSSTTLKGYINGVEAFSGSKSSTPQGPSGYTVNIGNAESVYYLGYISNLRIIRGTAVYTATFTPPTVPLTAVANTSLLTLQTNGAYNNSTFSDNSSFNNFVTRTGNVTNGTFSPYGNNWSNYFDGTGDYLSTATGLTSLDLTSTDFTLECWVYNTGPGAERYLFSQRGAGSGWEFRINAGNVCQFFYTSGSSLISTGTVVGNTWTHLAVTRSGTTVRIFINGALDSSATFSNGSNASASYGLYIGYGTSGGGYLIGYMSNARIVKGTALYTSAFTPSTTPLTSVANTSLLTCQSNRLIDNSPNNYTITKNGDTSVQKFSPFSTVTVPTYYSGYFDGTGDSLTIPSNAAFDLSNGSFTIELWALRTGVGTGDGFFIQRSNGGMFLFRWNASGTLQFYVNASSLLLSYAYAFPLNEWHHFAVVRNGNSFVMYLDGVSVSTSSSSETVTGGTADVSIGGYLTNGDFFQGYISNLRVVKGQALYTSNFTPSTALLTTTSQGATAANVSLLTCQSNTFIDNSTNYFTITVNGDTKPLAVSPFTPTASSATTYSATTFGGSMYFDGSGDYLTLSSASVSIVPGNFTIECWIYASANNVNIYAIGAETTSRLLFFVNGSSQLAYDVYGVGTTTFTGGTITLNSWCHIAWVRSGTTVTAYINGVKTGTATLSGSIGNGTQVAVGVNASLNSSLFSGYMSDLKATNQALYTAAFYPGSSPATPTYTIGTSTYPATLLLNGTAGGVVDASRNVDMETVGNARTTTSVSPYTGGGVSYYFDGTGDYLSIPSNPSLNFGPSNFTIELWAYFNSLANSPVLFHKVTGNSGWFLEASASIIYFGYGLTSSSQFWQASVTLTTGAWYHIAVTRVGAALSLFVNGTKQSNTLSGADGSVDNSTAVIIGSYRPVSSSYDLNGYIADLRITRGLARYTATFTPPTTPLSTK